MRTTEFIDEQTLDEWSSTDQEIVKILKKKGYRRLGAGADQTAFIEPSTGLVLKIFGTDKSNRLSDSQKMAIWWMKFSEKNSSNPFLPRYYGYSEFMFKGHKYLQMRTEPLKQAGLVGVYVEEIAMMADEAGGIVDSLEEIRNSLASEFPYMTKQLLQQLGKDGFKQLVKTVYALYTISERRGWNWDLHEGNVMLRADGTPVLNDPWMV